MGLKIVFLAAALLAAGGAKAMPACPAGPAPAVVLPHSAAALLANRQMLIVAFGSSSTRGWMASGIGHSYPAELQRDLEAGRDLAEFAVVNRGLGGDTAARELARLDRDVLALKPQLVIWQSGANEARQNEGAASFQAQIADGVRRMQAAGADVILVDNQLAPLLQKVADNAPINHALAVAAAETGAALFSRDQLMRDWARKGDGNLRFIAQDGLHMNDLGYDCLAQNLARRILAGLPPLQPRH
jgi:lysophospholipase L1-like esterase